MHNAYEYKNIMPVEAQKQKKRPFTVWTNLQGGPTSRECGEVVPTEDTKVFLMN